MTTRDFPVAIGRGSGAPADPAPGEVPPLRPAATVMLVRDGEAGLEVFVMCEIPANVIRAEESGHDASAFLPAHHTP